MPITILRTKLHRPPMDRVHLYHDHFLDRFCQGLHLIAIPFIPLHPGLVLGIRGDDEASSGEVPFYLRQFWQDVRDGFTATMRKIGKRNIAGGEESCEYPSLH